MKTRLILVLASTLGLISGELANADSLKLFDGTFKARFFGGCGILTVAGGRPVKYVFGNCGGRPTFSARPSFDASSGVMMIMAARFHVYSASQDRISGNWSLRGKMANVAFKR